MIEPGFEKVGEVFDAILRREPRGTSAQVVVRRHGRMVVDLAGSAPSTSPIDEDTPFLVFSVSKAFTSMAVMRLVEEGRVDLDAPIGRYWPGFAQRGKETATVRHALLHQAGIPAPHLRLQVFLWPFWNLVIRELELEPAQFPPGTQTGYHLVNFGFILGEVVRRVSGLPVDRYLRQTFFDPMGLKHTWMRIPASELRRCPKLVAVPEMQETANVFNLPIIRRALIPAACLHSSARGLADFFQMLLDGGEWKGKRYLKPETIALAAQTHYSGPDVYLKSEMNWGLGMIMGGDKAAEAEPRKQAQGWGSTNRTFSAMGMGTCMVWADPQAKLVTAFTTNSMLGDPEVGQRWAEISNAVWDSLVN